ncbi:MAG: protein kinase, partial [Planctomycetes bacterium]|nr:protein kinase [Planctomycetota bacterium]
MSENNPIQCPLCGHPFHPGKEGFVYCPSCGRRFNPDSSLADTVAITGLSNGVPIDPEAAPDAPADRRFGEYDIVEEIARGGMGVVYLARQRLLRRVVALKVLRRGDNASVEERERLLREAKAAAGLVHPNIVPIHEFSVHQGQPYFTMDFIEGHPLDRLLEKGPLNVREAVAIIEPVARAISFAHARGIIHRDLKPGNIIIDTEGRPMITDFGLAVELTPEAEEKRRMTTAGAIMGTIPYAPPEQAAGKIDQITERSDVYSMGAVLYEMVTGRPPFTGFTQFELLRRVINQEPSSPRLFNPKVHRDIETIILKCLEKDPRRRYASAKALAGDCQSFLKGEVIAARPATLGYRCRRFLVRRPLLSFLSACVAALSLAVWIGLGHFRALAKEKEITEQRLEYSLAAVERIAQEKELTEIQVRRDWRTEYSINFDYAFRWEGDIERSRNLSIPWLFREKASLLADPPRLALTDLSEKGWRSDMPVLGVPDLAFPFLFPRDVRVTLRVQTPREGVGELILLLDLDRNYRSHLGTTAVRFGNARHPGVTVYRSETVLGEEATGILTPETLSELVIERVDDRIRVLQDGKLIIEVDDPPAVFNNDAGRLTLDVREGTLEFFNLSVDLLGMSRSLAANLIETATNMAARGRADLALRLYAGVLLEP